MEMDMSMAIIRGKSQRSYWNAQRRFYGTNIDKLVKSLKLAFLVILAEARIQ